MCHIEILVQVRSDHESAGLVWVRGEEESGLVHSSLSQIHLSGLVGS